MLVQEVTLGPNPVILIWVLRVAWVATGTNQVIASTIRCLTKIVPFSLNSTFQGRLPIYGRFKYLRAIIVSVYSYTMKNTIKKQFE